MYPQEIRVTTSSMVLKIDSLQSLLDLRLVSNWNKHSLPQVVNNITWELRIIAIS